MEMESFSISMSGHYDTRENFRAGALDFIKKQVAERTGIPPSDFGSRFSGEWQSVSDTGSLIKEFTGEGVLERVLDESLGYEWSARFEIVSTGEDDEKPCEVFAGQIQLIVFE